MIFILLLFTAFAIFTVHLYTSRRKNPYGPFPLPIIGNLHQLGYAVWKTGGIVSGFQEIRKRYGNVFTLWFGPLPTVYIADYAVAHETHVKRANTFSARWAIGGLNYIREGRGIIGSNGEFWREHRRFALQTLRNFGLGKNVMEERIMEEFYYRITDFQSQNGEIIVHAGTFFDLLVGSIINKLLVSERFEKDDEEFEKLKNNLARAFESLSIIDAFTPLPLLKSRFMAWRTKKVFAPLDFVLKMTEKTVQKKIAAVKNGDVELDGDGDDFVEAFLIKMAKDNKDGVKNSSFTLDTLTIDIYDLWLAGQETTSTTLTWACACLLNNPHVVRKLREELLGVTRAAGREHVSLTDRTITPYLNATINEVQRISSILNVNLFRVMEEDTIIDGQPISSGTVFTTQLAMIHTDETLFKDHEQFDPERFIDDTGLEKKLIPFGIGKRSCPGESLARAELYLILGNLALKYDLEPVGGQVPLIKTSSPFGLMKRPPNYSVRLVPVGDKLL
uniref:CYtochrome P450 family n=1 Tax=Caenorhabditis japonica TaxID=281687 RepID=A0A8R1E1V4_CAEJA